MLIAYDDQILGFGTPSGKTAFVRDARGRLKIRGLKKSPNSTNHQRFYVFTENEIVCYNGFSLPAAWTVRIETSADTAFHFAEIIDSKQNQMYVYSDNSNGTIIFDDNGNLIVESEGYGFIKVSGDFVFVQSEDSVIKVAKDKFLNVDFRSAETICRGAVKFHEIASGKAIFIVEKAEEKHFAVIDDDETTEVEIEGTPADLIAVGNPQDLLFAIPTSDSQIIVVSALHKRIVYKKSVKSLLSKNVEHVQFAGIDCNLDDSTDLSYISDGILKYVSFAHLKVADVLLLEKAQTSDTFSKFADPEFSFYKPEKIVELKPGMRVILQNNRLLRASTQNIVTGLIHAFSYNVEGFYYIENTGLVTVDDKSMIRIYDNLPEQNYAPAFILADMIAKVETGTNADLTKQIEDLLKKAFRNQRMHVGLLAKLQFHKMKFLTRKHICLKR